MYVAVYGSTSSLHYYCCRNYSRNSCRNRVASCSVLHDDNRSRDKMVYGASAYYLKNSSFSAFRQCGHAVEAQLCERNGSRSCWNKQNWHDQRQVEFCNRTTQLWVALLLSLLPVKKCWVQTKFDGVKSDDRFSQATSPRSNWDDALYCCGLPAAGFQLCLVLFLFRCSDLTRGFSFLPPSIWWTNCSLGRSWFWDNWSLCRYCLLLIRPTFIKRRRVISCRHCMNCWKPSVHSVYLLVSWL